MYIAVSYDSMNTCVYFPCFNGMYFYPIRPPVSVHICVKVYFIGIRIIFGFKKLLECFFAELHLFKYIVHKLAKRSLFIIFETFAEFLYVFRIVFVPRVTIGSEKTNSQIRQILNFLYIVITGRRCDSRKHMGDFLSYNPRGKSAV